jgi:hypothetical protein
MFLCYCLTSQFNPVVVVVVVVVVVINELVCEYIENDLRFCCVWVKILQRAHIPSSENY